MPIKFEFFSRKPQKSLYEDDIQGAEIEVIENYKKVKPDFLEVQKYFWKHEIPNQILGLVEDTAKKIEEKEHEVLQRKRLTKNIVYHWEMEEFIPEKSVLWTVDNQGYSPDFQDIAELKLTSRGNKTIGFDSMTSTSNRIHDKYRARFHMHIRDVTIQYAYQLPDSETSGQRSVEGFGFNLEIGRDWFVLYDYSQDKKLNLPDNKGRVEPDQSHLILKYEPFKANLLFPGIDLPAVAHFSEWLESVREQEYKKLVQNQYDATQEQEYRRKYPSYKTPYMLLVEQFYKVWDAKAKEILKNTQADFMGTLRNEIKGMMDSRSYHYQYQVPLNTSS